MIWVLLALLVLFMYLYINDRREKKKKPIVEKKPTVEWYAKKLSDTFYDWKIICDNTNKSRWIGFHFKWKYYKWWKEKAFECIQYWWDILSLMKDIYDRFNREKEYRNRMSEQDLFSYILRLKPRM